MTDWQHFFLTSWTGQILTSIDDTVEEREPALYFKTQSQENAWHKPWQRACKLFLFLDVLIHQCFTEWTRGTNLGRMEDPDEYRRSTVLTPLFQFLIKCMCASSELHAPQIVLLSSGCWHLSLESRVPADIDHLLLRLLILACLMFEEVLLIGSRWEPLFSTSIQQSLGLESQWSHLSRMEPMIYLLYRTECETIHLIFRNLIVCYCWTMRKSPSRLW